MSFLEFTIQGAPIAKKRPRFYSRKTKSGKNFVGTYNAQGTEEGKFIQQVLVSLPGGFKPYQGAIAISLIYFIGRPKAHYGTGRNKDVLKASAPKYPTKIPDIDNYEKFVFDCLNEIVYQDDKQIINCCHM